MTIPRAFHTLTPLPDGQVLAAGGETKSSNHAGMISTTARALHSGSYDQPQSSYAQ
jgi:hypothetical protein